MWHNRAIPTELEFVLNGDLNELGRLAGEAERFCHERSLDGEVQFDLNLVLEELFINAVRHGGCEGIDQAVYVRLEAAGDEIRVEFRDRGRPFDPTTAPPPDLSRIGGLGIHLVRGLMRDFYYERSGDWNRITMRRPL
jgi:anti-sigma regulatory factor (Ser/Thr protein kinase)